MRCKRCGACCRIPHIPVGRKEAVPRELLDECDCGREFRMKYRNGACIALGKDGLCSIYPNRPKACREWEPGSCAPCPLAKGDS